jgi:F0F1-type ATP synthase membrane subunit c/vacuolar-type H+-ATPase subunit K
MLILSVISLGIVCFSLGFAIGRAAREAAREAARDSLLEESFQNMVNRHNDQDELSEALSSHEHK